MQMPCSPCSSRVHRLQLPRRVSPYLPLIRRSASGIICELQVLSMLGRYGVRIRAFLHNPRRCRNELLTRAFLIAGNLCTFWCAVLHVASLKKQIQRDQGEGGDYSQSIACLASMESFLRLASSLKASVSSRECIRAGAGIGQRTGRHDPIRPPSTTELGNSPGHHCRLPMLIFCDKLKWKEVGGAS